MWSHACSTNPFFKIIFELLEILRYVIILIAKRRIKNGQKHAILKMLYYKVLIANYPIQPSLLFLLDLSFTRKHEILSPGEISNIKLDKNTQKGYVVW